MELDFTGKVALITGAGNGIGRATALAFDKSGAKVVVVDRDTAGGEATAGVIRQQGGEAHFVPADVTKSAEVRAYVKAALDAYGAIDLRITRLRRKVEADPAHPEAIRTVRGVGYMFVPPKN